MACNGLIQAIDELISKGPWKRAVALLASRWDRTHDTPKERQSWHSIQLITMF